ncbi:MAG: DNA replication/repair protein RecF [Anaerolineae bacterium]|nr:DNA replication/repair protein RecF [Anaerolineae bacterium]
MHIRSLSLENFRNYVRLEQELPDRAVLLCGSNAQGKTSLLEAVYYLATSGSPLSANDRQLINWTAKKEGMAHIRLRAEVVQREQVREISIVLLLEPDTQGRQRLKRRVLIDQAPRKRRDLAGELNVVLFLPQDVELVTGSPAGRRRYLDDTLSQIDARYSAAQGTYTNALRQRNALLRHLAEQGGDPGQLEPLDGQLARSGVAISLARRRLINALSQHAHRTHGELSGGKEWLQMVYQPNFDLTRPPGIVCQTSFQESPGPPQGISDQDLVAAFRQQLRERRREEVERGMTLSGPHRDEMRFMIEKMDLGVYGSRGQQRTAVLALKIAQLAWMKQETGTSPVLLLDEVLAELDQHRREFLLAQVDQVEQALLTATDLEMFSPSFRQRATLLWVEKGLIQPYER